MKKNKSRTCNMHSHIEFQERLKKHHKPLPLPLSVPPPLPLPPNASVASTHFHQIVAEILELRQEKEHPPLRTPVQRPENVAQGFLSHSSEWKEAISDSRDDIVDTDRAIKLDKYRVEVDQLTKEITHQRTLILEQAEHCKELKSSLEAKETELCKTKVEILQILPLKMKVFQQQNKLEDVQKKLTSREAALAKINLEHEALLLRHRECQGSNSGLQDSIISLEKRLEALQAECEDVRSKLIRSDSLAEKRENEISKLQAALSSLEVEANHCEIDAKHWERRSQTLSRELANIFEMLGDDGVGASNDGLGGPPRLLESLEALKEENHILRSKLQLREEALDTIVQARSPSSAHSSPFTNSSDRLSPPPFMQHKVGARVGRDFSFEKDAKLSGGESKERRWAPGQGQGRRNRLVRGGGFGYDDCSGSTHLNGSDGSDGSAGNSTGLHRKKAASAAALAFGKVPHPAMGITYTDDPPQASLVGLCGPGRAFSFMMCGLGDDDVHEDVVELEGPTVTSTSVEFKRLSS